MSKLRNSSSSQPSIVQTSVVMMPRVQGTRGWPAPPPPPPPPPARPSTPPTPASTSRPRTAARPGTRSRITILSSVRVTNSSYTSLEIAVLTSGDEEVPGVNPVLNFLNLSPAQPARSPPPPATTAAVAVTTRAPARSHTTQRLPATGRR